MKEYDPQNACLPLPFGPVPFRVRQGFLIEKRVVPMLVHPAERIIPAGTWASGRMRGELVATFSVAIFAVHTHRSALPYFLPSMRHPLLLYGLVGLPGLYGLPAP